MSNKNKSSIISFVGDGLIRLDAASHSHGPFFIFAGVFLEIISGYLRWFFGCSRKEINLLPLLFPIRYSFRGKCAKSDFNSPCLSLQIRTYLHRSRLGWGLLPPNKLFHLGMVRIKPPDIGVRLGGLGRNIRFFFDTRIEYLPN